MHDAPATEFSPDHSTCRFCGEKITWDEVCYVHDDTGFADCGVYFEGRAVAHGVMFDPKIKTNLKTKAEPIEWEKK